MSPRKTSQGLLVRKVPFQFPEDFDPHWNRARPELSHMVNATSLFLPYMEPFIIDTVREPTEKLTDLDFVNEVKAWIGQESQHFLQHRRYNEVLIARGYPALREREKEIARQYDELRKRPLEFRLAYTAGFETMALFIGHMGLEQREYFFRGADPNVSSLWLWHLVEEIEHKNVAFDVYQRLYGGYARRLHGLVAALLHLVGMIRASYITLLETDGLWGRWRTRWAIKRIAVRFFAYLLPRLVLHDAMPWHHPSRIPDPAWMRAWVASFDKGEEGLARVDTGRIDRSAPVPDAAGSSPHAP